MRKRFHHRVFFKGRRLFRRFRGRRDIRVRSRTRKISTEQLRKFARLMLVAGRKKQTVHVASSNQESRKFQFLSSTSLVMTIISISHERAPQTISIRSVRAEMAAPLGRAAALFTRRIPARRISILPKPKFYILDMFPYPSGAGLHVGHPEGYTATDIVARYKRMRGFNVLHPMGWDAFGLPAEQYAIKTGQHPAITTRENIAKFKTQLKRIGFSYDWEREINTTDPRFYYKWTQWIFLQIYNSWFNPETNKAEPISTYRGDDPDSVRLAYVAEVPVNWCPELGTVLANEEVIDGKSEVGGFPVVRRPMRQWMLRITAYRRAVDR